MVKSNTPDHSLVKEIKRSWGNCICMFLKFNVPQITSCEVTQDGDLILNDNHYKFDVSDYTGNAERYVFFNPTNGRLVIEYLDKKMVYKFEVEFLE